MESNAEMAMRQASETAAEYLREAVRHAHETFGHSYCQRNPGFYGAIVAALVQAAAQDFDSSVRAGIVGNGGQQ
jgi:hypothetical protein